MANYADIIERAIARLDDNTPDKRTLIYKKARTALSKQLDALDPPASDVERDEQLAALDISIEAIELKYTKAIVHKAHHQDESYEATHPHVTQPDDDGSVQDSVDTTPSDPDVHDAVPENEEPSKNTAASVSEPDHEHSDPFLQDTEDNNTTSQQSQSTSVNEKAEKAPQPRKSKNHHEEPSPEMEEIVPFSPSADLTTSSVFVPDKRSRFGRKRDTILTRILTYILLLVLLVGIVWGISILAKNYLFPLFETIKSEGSLSLDDPQHKIPERLADDSAQAEAGPAPDTPAVAQTALLYNEDPNNPQQGNVFKASVTWRAEHSEVPNAQGNVQGISYIRGLIEVPEKQFKLVLSVKRNTDESLPASHTIELLFDLPENFENGGIQNVPGLIMKQGERARGQPLIGASARITNGFFIIGLSSVSLDRNRNLLLMREQKWLEIPILYENDRRGILVLEKGIPGDKIFREVLDQWALLEANVPTSSSTETVVDAPAKDPQAASQEDVKRP